MRISLTQNDDDLKRYANQIGAIGQKKAHVAFARAINRVTTTVRGKVARAVARQSSIPVSLVRKQMVRKTVRPGGGGVLEGAVVGTGGAIPLRVFRPKQFTWGVRVKLWGKQQRYSGMFIYAGRYNSGKEVATGQVFQRTTTASLPIERQFGPAVPAEMIRTEARKEFERTVADMLPKRIQHELSRMLPD